LRLGGVGYVMVPICLGIASMESNLVQRYQEYRRISGDIQSEVLEMVPGMAMIEFGRRLGALWHGKVALDDPNDLKLLYDIAIHPAKPGRTRAVDRYAHKARFPDGSDNALILHSLRNAYCTMFEFRSRHNVAGAVAWDLLRKQEFHLLDISLGLSAKPGDCYVARLMDIYPVHAIIRNSVGFMIRKLSVTSSQ
jgi:hypothetical protein